MTWKPLILLAEAAHALGIPDDAKTWPVARLLVDHALDYGWDREHGGFYDTGTAFGAPANRDKIWWTQAEGLNALLLLHERFGRETPRYGEAFCANGSSSRTIRSTKRTAAGIRPCVTTARRSPVSKEQPLDRGVHQGRALLNVSASLRRLAGNDDAAAAKRR
jgi:mannobiose 2-epimerase